MKKLTLKRKLIICIILLGLFFVPSCRKDTLLPPKGPNSLTITEAKSYFENYFQKSIKPKSIMSTDGSGKGSITQQSPIDGKLPMWDASILKNLALGANAVLAPMHKEGLYVHISDKRMVKFGFLNYMMMYKNEKDSIITEWVELKPTEKWIDAKFSREYDGRILVRNWNGKIKKVYSFIDGVSVPTNKIKLNKLASINGSTMDSSTGGDVNCFVTTTTTITTIPAKPCPCDGHVWGQPCYCDQTPTQGGQTIKVVVEYDCDIPDDPDGPTGGTGNNGGTGQTGNPNNPGGGGTPNPNDYTPINCNPDPNYTIPTIPPPPGMEYILPCSSIAFPTEGTPNPTTQTSVTPAQFVIQALGITDLDKVTFISDPASGLSNGLAQYLIREQNSPYSIEFGQWLFEYLYSNQSVDYHDFLDSNEFSGINNPPTTAPIEPAIDMTGIIDIPVDAILGTPRLLASTPNRNNTEDLEFGTNGNISGILPSEIAKNDNLLFSDMTDLFEWVSVGDLQTVAGQFIDRFRNSTGGTYENQMLNNEVKESVTYKDFISNFRHNLAAKINNAGGILDNTPINLSYRPAFKGWGNRLKGLQILINDTEQTQIKLLNFQINPATQEWIADVEVTIYDHFGLDKHDALAYQGNHRGFAAWWILQHKRNYKPFITKIVVRNRLYGGL